MIPIHELAYHHLLSPVFAVCSICKSVDDVGGCIERVPNKSR